MKIIAIWVSKSEAKRIRHQYVLDHLDDKDQSQLITYLAKVALENDRQTWMVLARD